MHVFRCFLHLVPPFTSHYIIMVQGLLTLISMPGSTQTVREITAQVGGTINDFERTTLVWDLGLGLGPTLGYIITPRAYVQAGLSNRFCLSVVVVVCHKKI